MRMWPHIGDDLAPLLGLTHSQKGGEEAKAFPMDRTVLSNQALSTFGILDSYSTLRKTEHIFAVWHLCSVNKPARAIGTQKQTVLTPRWGHKYSCLLVGTSVPAPE